MFNKKYFIVTIGKETSSLIYMEGEKVFEHIKGDLGKQKQEIDRIFALSKYANIILLLNNEEQLYKKEVISGKSKAEIEKIMKTKLKDGYDESVFKGVKELKCNANSVEYLFITISKNDRIITWLDYLVKLPNRIQGIYSFTLEAENLKADNEFEALDVLVGMSAITNKRHYKLYNPDISSLILTDMMNYYMNLVLIGGIILMIMIFFGLWEYVEIFGDKVMKVKESLNV